MIIEALKALIFGIVEGITEWLPISSTGHLILTDEFVKLDVSPEFLSLFLVVIQIGAIMAVIILYFAKLNPFSRKKTPAGRRRTWRLWGMVVIGSVPAAIVGLLADDWVHDNFYNAGMVASMLILYGIIFIIMEHRNANKLAAAVASGEAAPRAIAPSVDADGEVLRGKHARDPKTGQLAVSAQRAQMAGASFAGATAGAGAVEVDPDSIFRIREVENIDIKTALKIGCFQVLAIIPGTSRSGATIIGGMLCGVSRTAAAEFTFFLAIPVMFGWGLVKAVKFFKAGAIMSQNEMVVLVVGVVTAFIVSVLSIKFLMGYIKNNDFAPFGWYRIVVGIVLLAYFGFMGTLLISQVM